MKVSLILVVVSMMVTLDMSYACTQLLLESCKSSMQSSLRTIETTSQACRILDTYLKCLRLCGNQDKRKQLAYKLLADKGIECGKSQNSSPDSGGMVSSNTQVMDILSHLTCPHSVASACSNQYFFSFLNGSIKTIPQACRAVKTFIDCLRPCGVSDALKKVAYKDFHDKGIECGSAMVTLSGAMVMLMLFTTLRNFF